MTDPTTAGAYGDSARSLGLAFPTASSTGIFHEDPACDDETNVWDGFCATCAELHNVPRAAGVRPAWRRVNDDARHLNELTYQLDILPVDYNDLAVLGSERIGRIIDLLSNDQRRDIIGNGEPLSPTIEAAVTVLEAAWQHFEDRRDRLNEDGYVVECTLAKRAERRLRNKDTSPSNDRDSFWAVVRPPRAPSIPAAMIAGLKVLAATDHIKERVLVEGPQGVIRELMARQGYNEPDRLMLTAIPRPGYPTTWLEHALVLQETETTRLNLTHVLDAVAAAHA